MHPDWAGEGEAEIAGSLLLKGAAINARSDEDSTPLGIAAQAGHVAVTEVLLIAGGDHTLRFYEDDLSALDLAASRDHATQSRGGSERGVPYRLTALHWAAENNSASAIDDVLVEAGADIQAGQWRSPLHFAAEGGPDATLASLNFGAEVCTQTAVGGETALHRTAGSAAKRGSGEVVDLLLRWGADETITTRQGETAVERIGTRRIFRKVPEEVERVQSLLA